MRNRTIVRRLVLSGARSASFGAGEVPRRWVVNPQHRPPARGVGRGGGARRPGLHRAPRRFPWTRSPARPSPAVPGFPAENHSRPSCGPEPRSRVSPDFRGEPSSAGSQSIREPSSVRAPPAQRSADRLSRRPNEPQRRPERAAFLYSRLSVAILAKGMPFGHDATHSPVLVQPPNPSASIVSTMSSTR